MFQTAVMAEVNNSSENEYVTSLEASIDEKIYEDEYSLFYLGFWGEKFSQYSFILKLGWFPKAVE